MTVRRLTYISYSTLPSRAANSVHVMKMANAFAAQECSTQLVAFRSIRRPSSKKGIRCAYDVSDDFRLSLLPPAPRRISRSYLSKAGLALARHWRSDLVYTRVPQAAALCARFGMPCCLELHHPVSHDLIEGRALTQFLSLEQAAPIVTITEALKNKLIADLGCSSEQIFVAHDAADPMRKVDALTLPPPTAGRLRVGFLGHLYRGKGMELIEQLVPAVPWADFLIVGGTKKDIDFWKDRMHGLDNIHFEGFVPHTQTAGYLRSFDIALLPNQNHVGVSGNAGLNISRWTSPLKAFEYMAAGLPIIASDQENLREVFRDGYNGLLCPPDQPTAWIAALTKLRANPDLMIQLGKRAHENFVERHSWNARARNILGFLSSIEGSRYN